MKVITNNLQYQLISELENSLINLSELIEKSKISDEQINSDNLQKLTDELFYMRYKFDKQRIKFT